MKNSKIALLALALLVSCSNQITPPQLPLNLTENTLTGNENGSVVDDGTSVISIQALVKDDTACLKYLQPGQKIAINDGTYTYTIDEWGRPIKGEGFVPYNPAGINKYDRRLDCQSKLNKWTREELANDKRGEWLAWKTEFTPTGKPTTVKLLNFIEPNEASAGHLVAVGLGGRASRINMNPQTQYMNEVQSMLETEIAKCTTRRKSGVEIKYEASVEFPQVPLSKYGVAGAKPFFIPLEYSIKITFKDNSNPFVSYYGSWDNLIKTISALVIKSTAAHIAEKRFDYQYQTSLGISIASLAASFEYMNNRPKDHFVKFAFDFPNTLREPDRNIWYGQFVKELKLLKEWTSRYCS